jgi:hypothetical protein
MSRQFLAVRQSVVDQVGDQDAAGDGQLVEADQATADPRWGDLADVERHDHRRGADREPDDDPRHDEDVVGRREGSEQHAGHEQHGGAQDGGPTADLVGDPSRRQSADGRSDQQDAGQQFLVERGQAGEALPTNSNAPEMTPVS